jgi:hypothetical protein
LGEIRELRDTNNTLNREAAVTKRALADAGYLAVAKEKDFKALERETERLKERVRVLSITAQSGARARAVKALAKKVAPKKKAAKKKVAKARR